MVMWAYASMLIDERMKSTKNVLWIVLFDTAQEFQQRQHVTGAVF